MPHNLWMFKYQKGSNTKSWQRFGTAQLPWLIVKNVKKIYIYAFMKYSAI